MLFEIVERQVLSDRQSVAAMASAGVKGEHMSELLAVLPNPSDVFHSYLYGTPTPVIDPERRMMLIALGLSHAG